MLGKKKLEFNEEDYNSRKGTLVSVSLVGLFIVALWFGIWGLYMMRF
ncbi:cytochrome c oxidase subunit 2A [Alkalibacillus aidingensis]|nr:cytochrome c oxidase subunit 2A [Alkalibacillus aidingensis]